MWALRRASIPLRGFNVRASCVKLTRTSCVEEETAIYESPRIKNGEFFTPKTYFHSGNASLKFTVSRRELSSSSTKEEDDLEDGFSELEMPAADGSGKENDDLLTNETDLSDGSDSDDVEEPHNEIDESAKKNRRRRWAESELFKEIVNAPDFSVHSALEKWVKEGKELNRQEISLAMFNLRRRRLFVKALQLSEWLQSKKQFEFIERDYASRLDLIAKVHGLQKAEAYIETIPESCRTEIMYRTLLANSVFQKNTKKAEEIFSKMKDLGFPVTVFPCNQLLLLYKRVDMNKIADLLLFMENENIKPSALTFEILIDTKGQSKDIAGMEQIVERMKAQGIEPSVKTQIVVFRHYISAGHQDKAETLLKEMEGKNLIQNRWLCRILPPFYANLGKEDEVRRIWEVCEANPRVDECVAVIEAWGKLNKINEAEKVFEIMLKKSKLSSRNCSVLLYVYANNKMLVKGKDLIKRMAESGQRIGPLTLDAIVKLYVQSGEVEKADSILHKAAQLNPVRPLYSTFLTMLEQYAKRGDIHNSEKIFVRMKQAKYQPGSKIYQILMQAYINAKLPAYGIRDRIKADNINPNKALASQLVQVDGFRKNPVSDLLD
ncbi:pentatricopeptide repeat-containing protein At1g80270, mitochondrial-like isoform X2 [Abrus precatorius]|uniref:Pentatricopeptide repeat-containing protein At1g80270, mitochondrial-like isoform X2 n=1 Tax=Abrus precatorius TaxID=3816 RepID=A0A8B8L3G9_ABRPR|nr:pentatricopeptide repeat-containing protein At1g80270, mitochondrial-like isoform X2 [Abrus precatorius]